MFQRKLSGFSEHYRFFESLTQTPSLMPVPQLSQKQVGVVTRIVDVVKNCVAAKFAGVIDDDIAKAVAEDPNAVPLDIDWTKARLVMPSGKESVTLRVDKDVLDWFRRQGRGYQTRINAVLRAYKDAHQDHDL